MAITINLTEDDLAEIKLFTRLTDPAEAVAKAAREFVRLRQLRELKHASGRVDFIENWQQLEALELGEMTLPQ